LGKRISTSVVTITQLSYIILISRSTVLWFGVVVISQFSSLSHALDKDKGEGRGSKARHLLFKIWRFAFLEKRKSPDCSSGKTSENSRFLGSILSFFLPSVVDKISRFFFLQILSLNLLTIQFTFHRVSFLFFSIGRILLLLLRIQLN
jgi:hypothetical protein